MFFRIKDDETPIRKHRRARALNWKQCSWNNLNSDVNDGKICVRAIRNITVRIELVCEAKFSVRCSKSKPNY